jgi:hypothetical protein
LLPSHAIEHVFAGTTGYYFKARVLLLLATLCNRLQLFAKVFSSP